MSEQVFGLSINQIMAYTAIANVVLVVVLTAVNIYYAGHAKRQADAAREQVAASNRQSEIAAETLSLVRKQMDQQLRTDIAAVTLQLKVAIHVIEDWLKRISSGQASPVAGSRLSSSPPISAWPRNALIRLTPSSRKTWERPRCTFLKPRPTSRS